MLYIEQGPSSLLILAERKGEETEPDDKRILDLLTRLQREIRDALPILRLRSGRVVNSRHLPWIARRMIEAARMIAPSELTAMSAVAGAVSEEIKACLMFEGFDLVVVNNGGDIAAYCATDGPVNIAIGRHDVGVRGGGSDIVLNTRGPFELGIATSGLGGRSLTKGVADVVTVVAKDAALADAAATFLCNATHVSSPRIEEALAETLDHTTDIPGETVTVSVGALEMEEIEDAVKKGLEAAEDLINRGLIMDAVIDVKGFIATTMGPHSKVKLEEGYADKKVCNGCRGGENRR